MPIVRPRLTDYHGILLPQAQADFAIPFLDEDIPLYLDPFLLWRSPSQQDNALHTAIINSFNHLGYLEKQGKHAEAVEILTTITECDEVGSGHSHTREGRERPRPRSCLCGSDIPVRHSACVARALLPAIAHVGPVR